MSIEKLKEYDRLYEMGLSPISDKDYDNFRDEMFKKFPNDPYFKSVGSFVDSRDKVELPFILGSLNKLKTDGSCKKWLSKHDSEKSIIITPKLDGVSIAVHFMNGKVTDAYLRGDGSYGRSITNKCKQFIKPIKDKSSLWFRGEILLDHLPDGYTNKRSATAGIINDDDNEKLYLLNVMFYEHINSDDNSEDNRMKFIKSLFPDNSVNSTSMKVKNLDDNTLVYMLKTYKEMWTQYDIDGLVLTLDKSIRENVKYPKNKVSFKVNQEAIFTTVKKNIEWNTGRTGRVIPLVYIDPITIDGSTINKATGHNAKFIKDKFIKKGTKISIVRSGDVIPYIVDVESEDKEYNLPEKCSTCDTHLKEKGVDLICPNNLCPSQILKTIEHFIKKLGIMNVSLSTIEKLNIKTLEDLYNLTEKDIMSLDGFGKKKASHLYNEIRSKLKTTPEKFLASMGVSGLGEEIASKILSKMSFKEFLNANRYDHIDGIGSVTNDNIIENRPLIFKNYCLLSNYGLEFLKKNEDSEYEGKIFTLTGTAPLKRDDLVRILESKGSRVKGISKNVDFLVTNDVESNSSKTKKAKQYNVPIITYDKLLNELGVIE